VTAAFDRIENHFAALRAFAVMLASVSGNSAMTGLAKVRFSFAKNVAVAAADSTLPPNPLPPIVAISPPLKGISGSFAPAPNNTEAGRAG
jgi:hypothetical protein